MTIRDIAVAFGFEVDRNSEKQAENSIKGIKNLATKLLGAIGIGFSIAGLSVLAETAAEADALKSQFTQVFGEMETDATNSLKAIEADTGVLVNRMKGSFTQIAAFSKTTGLDQAQSLEIADRAMKAVTDSAAFYDRSIEDVTESVRSFLKGNFEQDAALGLSATETTRNAAANELYGKSFKDLSEAEKQFTLLSMVEQANKASGALGQAARESDTWTNQLGNLKQSVTDLKAATGSAFLQQAVQVLKILNALVQKGTAAIQEMTGENGVLTHSFERLHALIKRLRPAIDRMNQTLSRGISKGIEVVKSVVDKLGGIENVLKIAAIAAGAFIAVMSATKILKMIKAVGALAGIVSKLAKVFGLANLKVLAIIAVVVILALIIEDFINFMMGNESVIGTLFDKAGIGADNAKEAIVGAWNAVRNFLGTIWRAIQEMGKTIFGELSAWWEANGQSVLDSFSQIWRSIVKLCEDLWTGLFGIAKMVFGLMQMFWEAWGGTIIEVFGTLWNTLIALISPFFDAMAAVIDFLANVFSGNWQGALQSILDFATAIWQMIVLVFTGAWDSVCAIWEKLSEIFGNYFQAAKDTVMDKVSSIRDTVVNGFQSAIDWLRGLPPQAVQWGADFIGGLKDGILSGAQGIVDAVKGIGEKIRSYLHFSVPDVGPLTDYESWMPDFMGGLAKGISENESIVLDKVKKLAGGIATLIKAAVAQPTTATTSTVNNKTSNITQNVNIDNTYSGGSADAQKAVSKSMKKSATDATTQMARALEYARG